MIHWHQILETHSQNSLLAIDLLEALPDAIGLQWFPMDHRELVSYLLPCVAEQDLRVLWMSYQTPICINEDNNAI